MKVRVKEGQTGYFDHIRRREGDVFVIPDEPRREVRKSAEYEKDENGKEVRYRGQRILDRPADLKETQEIADGAGTVPLAFSGRWMEPADAVEPEKVTTSPQALKKKHDELLASKAPGKGTGSAEVI